MNKKTEKYLLSTLIVLFLLITLGVISHNPLIERLDNISASIMTIISSPTLNSFMISITNIGSGIGTIFIFAIFAIYLFLKKNRHSLYTLTLAAGSAVVLNEIIKLLVERVRPVSRLITETDFSFPSGHATISIIFFLSSLFLIAPSILNRYLRISFQILTTIVFLLVAMSRIYLSVHWASDVLASFVLASICFLTSWICVSRFVSVA